MGMRATRQVAAVADAATVFTATGSDRVLSYESSSVSTPVLAAVSPNRESGPWNSAGPIPR